MSPSQDEEKRGMENGGEEEPVTIYSLMQREGTRQHLWVYWVYSFLMITLSEVFPLYCMSSISGLGITEKVIGNILSACGLLYLGMQYFIVTGLVDRYGFYKSLRIGACLSIPLAFFFPISLITNKGAPDGTLTLISLVFLSVLFGVIRSFSSLVFSTITMATNRTVPEHQRATLNGLAMLGGSFAKGLGPLFGGILFSTSVNTVTPPFGSVVVYSTMGLLGICLCVQTYFLCEYDEDEKESRQATKGDITDSDIEMEVEQYPTC
eukprot:jgi/Psemu1/323818/estExt_fgenesh1_pg.C_970001